MLATFVWDPSGETLIRPATTRVRVTAIDTESGEASVPVERVLTRPIGPSETQRSTLRGTGEVAASTGFLFEAAAGDFDGDGQEDLVLGLELRLSMCSSNTSWTMAMPIR